MRKGRADNSVPVKIHYTTLYDYRSEKQLMIQYGLYRGNVTEKDVGYAFTEVVKS